MNNGMRVDHALKVPDFNGANQRRKQILPQPQYWFPFTSKSFKIVNDHFWLDSFLQAPRLWYLLPSIYCLVYFTPHVSKRPLVFQSFSSVKATFDISFFFYFFFFSKASFHPLHSRLQINYMPQFTLQPGLLLLLFLASGLIGAELQIFVDSFPFLPDASPWQYVLLWSCVPLGAFGTLNT